MSVLIEKHDSIFTVIINRPSLKNCVDAATSQALVKAFKDFDEDDRYSVAILCSAGGTFCTGWDLKAAVATASDSLNGAKSFTQGTGKHGEF